MEGLSTHGAAWSPWKAGRRFPGPARGSRAPRVAAQRLPWRGWRRVLAPSGDFTAVPGAALGWALGGAGGLHLSEAASLVGGAGGERVGAAVHHPGIQATGHGEGFEVAPQGHGQREPVDQVHGRAGHHGSAAEVLEGQHLGEETKGDRVQFMTQPDHLPPRAVGAERPLAVPTCGTGQGRGPEPPAVFPSRSKRWADLEGDDGTHTATVWGKRPRASGMTSFPAARLTLAAHVTSCLRKGMFKRIPEEPKLCFNVIYTNPYVSRAPCLVGRGSWGPAEGGIPRVPLSHHSPQTGEAQGASKELFLLSGS